MPIPNPEPARYLLHLSLALRTPAGREEGQKDRPSVIVLAVEREADGATLVTVLPITRTAPRDPAAAVEIPMPVKRHLGLDDDRS
jgi:mRNA-degrading endonuclease toxin of MazEF toxin-antitoxin module